MMAQSKEERFDVSDVDFSVDEVLIEQARRLVCAGQNISVEQAKNWINSPIKRRWEISLGLFSWAIMALPTLALQRGILLADGKPLIHRLYVGFVGNGEIVNYTASPKLRTLRVDSDIDEPVPSVLRGRRQTTSVVEDRRVHSTFGRWLRRTSIDEIPQLREISRGKMALIGPRGYYGRNKDDGELAVIKILFDHYPEKLPEFVRNNYRRMISEFRPRPGALSLYTATLKKDLTPPERLWMDLLYLDNANPLGDLAIFKATIKTLFSGAGAR